MPSSRARPPVCPARPAATAGICRRRRPDAGAGHRRQCRGVPRGVASDSQAAALSEADRLVRVWEDYRRGGRELTNIVAPGNFVDWQRDTHTFAAFARLQRRFDTRSISPARGSCPTRDVRTYGDYFPSSACRRSWAARLAAADATPGRLPRRPQRAPVAAALRRGPHVVGRHSAVRRLPTPSSA